ncbi:CMP-N-acetylneuraminate-beta-galactosamide-alpha-2,3-sialyltransferase 1-like [Scleropages formosus]|nr:CMP-N-acetylneuraminate-beta-galactosamide-alpha-2,3-sialyltransferase 1-like [Scleropages formosus]
MFVLKRRKSRIFAVLLFIVTLATLFFMYVCHVPWLYFFKFLFSPKRTCACGECLADKYDNWFSERFNQSISPVLSEKNILLSEDTYRWWLQLQSETDPANFSMVVKTLFQIIPNVQWYMDLGPLRCRTCAVVGNSENLRGSNYGTLIDSNDFIIRMNKAPTIGFEKDVGRRTTHHLMYPESARHLENTTNLILIPFKTLDLQWIASALTTGTIKRTYMPVLPRITANRDKVLIYSPTFLKYVYNNWLENHGRYPSTGFLALMFAIHICDQVSVFGFGADKEGNWYHYWEKNASAGAFRHTGVHDGDFEYNVTMLLVDKHKVKFF